MKHLQTTEPCRDLAADPNKFPELFSKPLDGDVKLIETLEGGRVLVFAKSHAGTEVEHAFVGCHSGQIDWPAFGHIHELYGQAVLKLGQDDYKEVEPVLIANGFTDDVLQFLQTYEAEYPLRKPYRLFTF